MKIIAVTTCFNRKEKTKNAILSLSKGNENIDFEFVIVDDCSNDGTQMMLRDIQVNNKISIHCLTGTGSLYYSGGMRIGLQYALEMPSPNADYLLLFNDDVVFYPNVTQKLIRLSGQNDIVVGTTDDGYGTTTYGGIMLESKFRPKFRIATPCDGKNILCDTFNANCVLIPFSVFRQIGNMDAAYQHSLGDFDYGLTASRGGFRILASDFFVGKCKTNDLKDTWLDNRLTIRQRLTAKKAPKGLPSKCWFHFLLKNFGFQTAVLYSLTPFVRIFLRK